jgi:DNA-directed RNA polymerase subunit RPC12/RpoP
MTRAIKPFQSTHPVSINEGFKCVKCGKTNPRAKKTCRNHCTECLYSVHVDKDIPGDRLSTCLGAMEPLIIGYNAKKGFQITHQCLKCGKEVINKSAEDDNTETIAKIMSRQNTTSLPETNISMRKKSSRAKPHSRICKNKSRKS